MGFSSSPDKTPDPGGCDNRNGREMFPRLRASQTPEHLAQLRMFCRKALPGNQQQAVNRAPVVSNQIIMLHARHHNISQMDKVVGKLVKGKHNQTLCEVNNIVSLLQRCTCFISHLPFTECM